jgi:hypothetical protein
VTQYTVVDDSEDVPLGQIYEYFLHLHDTMKMEATGSSKVGDYPPAFMASHSRRE